MKLRSAAVSAAAVPASATSTSTQVSVSRRQFRLAFAGLLLTLALAALDQNIVATALPQIVGDLGGLRHLSWVVTAFMLTSTVSAPLYGKLSDLHGRRPLFIAAIGLFLAGSVLCGLARDMGELIAFRGLQGLGAGGLMTLTQITIADLVGGLGRARYQGFFSGVYALCSVAGPLLGGVLTESLSWRWIFYVNLPLGAAALVLILLGVPRSEGHGHPRVDYGGAVLLTIGTTALLLTLSWAGAVYAWLSPEILGLTAVTLVILTTLVWYEMRVSEPLLPMRLFRDRVFRVGVSTVMLASLALFGAILFMPLYFQVALDVGPTDAGLLLTPLMAGVVVASIFGGRWVANHGRLRMLTVVGLGVASAAFLVLAWAASVDAGMLSLELALVIMGLGLGAAMPNLTTAIQNGVAQRDLGVATSAANVFRSVGGALGVAFAGALLNMVLQARLGVAAGHSLSAGAPGQGAESVGKLLSAEAIAAYRAGIAVTLLCGGIVLSCASVVAVFLPDQRIVSTGRVAER